MDTVFSKCLKRAATFSLPALMLMSSGSFAGVQLDRMIVYFDADKLPRQDITVSNPDREPLYLETEIIKVENPGSKDEKRVVITDPDKMQLLATPGRAIIAPGSQKTVRLVNLDKPPKVEQVYRVTFRPVVGELKASQTAVKVLVAYQALAFIRPENPFHNVSAKTKGEEMTFTNKGNSNAVLRDGRYCPASVKASASFEEKEKKCRKITDTNRLYAGQSWTITLPEKARGGFVEYGLFNGQEEQTRQFPVN